ncbi:methyltransferase [Fontivita pretiosa]|uniref:methyltransferase n=1 Tax=Fontivita pretiosa TaxID=2989684 RepID=UPI003D183587
MDNSTGGEWTAERVNELSRAYQASSILAAAAELELFGKLASGPFTAGEASARLGADPRAITILLDALVAVQLLEKDGQQYRVPAGVARLLDGATPGNQLAMAQHQANCLRRWAQLARVVKTGRPPARQPSIRGEQADYAAFIEAMDNVSGPVADKIVQQLQPLHFEQLLDVGGGSGTWTVALLRANPAARAIIFDLPQVMPQARQRIASAGLADRVMLVSGDFYTDPLPGGVDLAWVSAIVHQNSRQQNRRLFASVFSSLRPGGQILIRDILMDASRTSPVAGALFAVNMLVATDQGGTFTFEELRDDLTQAGFTDVLVRRRDPGMNSVVAARKP